MPDKPENDAQEIWEQFCEQLKQAGQVLNRCDLPADDINLAEGLRHLVRSIRMGFEMSCEYADTDYPQIAPAYTATMMAEGPTSDCRYHHAFINGEDTYVLQGKLGTAPWFEFSVYAGKIGLQDASRLVSSITETELQVEADGCFEILLSPEHQPGNWLRTDSDSSYLFLREYAFDWSETRGSHFDIARRGATGRRPPPDLAEMRIALARTAAFVEKGPRFWGALVDQHAAGAANRFHTITQARGEDSPTMPIGHQFSFGYFKLAPDEALLLEFEPVDIPYWAIQLTNCWFEALSLDDNSARINNSTAARDSDGRVRIVIMDGAGNRPNAIDTLGHCEGTMVFRWSRTVEPVPTIEATVVKRTDLAPESNTVSMQE